MGAEYKKIIWGVVAILILALVYFFYSYVPNGRTPDTENPVEVLERYSTPSQNSLPINAEVLDRYSAPSNTNPSPIDPDLLENYSVPELQ